MSCLDLYEQLGMSANQVDVFDSKGHINTGREGLDASSNGTPTIAGSIRSRRP